MEGNILNPEEDIYVSLDVAFQSLLEQRDKDIFVDSFGEPVIIDDDYILCNKNLQTALLFKNLNIKYIELNDMLIKINDDESRIIKCMNSYKSNFNSILNFYLSEKQISIGEIESLEVKHNSITCDVDYIFTNFVQKKRELASSIENKLDSISRKLDLIRETIVTCIQGIVKPDDMVKKMCPVCFDREVDTVLVPCGHTYCNGCSEYDRNSKCPQCRATVQRRIKIYFSI